MDARILTLSLLCLLLACSSGAPKIPPLPAEATILCFGDSLTYGTGADRGESYPAILEELTDRTVVNAGVPGEVTAGGVRRLPGTLEKHRPDLLILMHGGNDILRNLSEEEMTTNLKTMVDMAVSRGVPVVLLGVPRFGLRLTPPDLYEKIAEELRLAYDGDVLPAIERDPALKSDPIHPNGAGYRRLAEGIYGLLEAAGAV